MFSIRSLGSIFSNIDLNIIRTDGLYIFIGPTTINLEKDSDEHLEYNELYKDIKIYSYVKTNTIKYNIFI